MRDGLAHRLFVQDFKVFEEQEEPGFEGKNLEVGIVEVVVQLLMAYERLIRDLSGLYVFEQRALQVVMKPKLIRSPLLDLFLKALHCLLLIVSLRRVHFHEEGIERQPIASSVHYLVHFSTQLVVAQGELFLVLLCKGRLVNELVQQKTQVRLQSFLNKPGYFRGLVKLHCGLTTQVMEC